MKIFVTRKIPNSGLKLLEREYEVEVNPLDRRLTKQEIVKGVKGKSGLLCLLTDIIDKDIVQVEPRLKIIANYAAGYDNIDVKSATQRGIFVSNTPDVLTDATADMAWALLFAVSRRIVEGDAFIRAGKFKGWSPSLMLGQDISNKTLGVIGAGRIGTAFALKSRGFNMKVIYVSSRKSEILEKELNAVKTNLNILVKKADFISLHVPLSPSTKHLIGEKELKNMKNTAIIINTSRGPVIDEKALIKALREKWIFGAGLDVYEHEPSIPNELKKLENVVLQPHSASATFETRNTMAVLVAKNMIAGLKDELPPNCINPEVFRKK